MDFGELVSREMDFIERMGWDKIPPEQIYIHLVEEVGEIGRNILYRLGYKEGSPSQEEVAREIGQAMNLLIHLSLALGVDPEEALILAMEEMERRFGEQTNT